MWLSPLLRRSQWLSLIQHPRPLEGSLHLELHIPSNNNTPQCGYVKPTGLRDLTVTHKYTFLCSGFELGPLLLGDMWESNTTKNPEVSHLRLMPYESLLWCHVPQYPVRTAVLQVYISIAGLSPKKQRHTLIMCHSASNSNNNLFFLSATPFCWGCKQQSTLFECPLLHISHQNHWRYTPLHCQTSRS